MLFFIDSIPIHDQRSNRIGIDTRYPINTHIDFFRKTIICDPNTRWINHLFILGILKKSNSLFVSNEYLILLTTNVQFNQ